MLPGEVAIEPVTRLVITMVPFGAREKVVLLSVPPTWTGIEVVAKVLFAVARTASVGGRLRVVCV